MGDGRTGGGQRRAALKGSDRAGVLTLASPLRRAYDAGKPEGGSDGAEGAEDEDVTERAGPVRLGRTPGALRARPPVSAGRGWRDHLVNRLTSPPVLRPVFALFRRFVPVARLGRVTLVSRHADVVSVLERDNDFTIAEVNAERMTRWSGDFILGMDRGADYEREAAALQRATRPEDLDRIRTFVATTAIRLIDAARPEGRIDVVNGYARVVATGVVGDYFGAPGPDQESTMRWMRALFDAVFLDDSRRARHVATLAVAEQRPYMEKLIRTRRAELASGEPVPDDVLTRLVAMGTDEAWLDDDAVRRNVNGLIVGALDTTSKAVALVVDELLRRPVVLAGARQSALSGDMGAVRGYAWEALRFVPHGPTLQRHCARDTTLAGATLKKGGTVTALILSAGFDKKAFPEPRRFRHDRPPDRYLHFGHGLHTCFGRHINAVQVPELVAGLLRLSNLRRAPAGEGRLVYDGPFPDRLMVAFDEEGGG